MEISTRISGEIVFSNVGSASALVGFQKHQNIN